MHNFVDRIAVSSLNKNEIHFLLGMASWSAAGRRLKKGGTMKETQGALGMLLRRYRLILGKCRLRNALAGLLLGAVLLAPAVSPADSGCATPDSIGYEGNRDITGLMGIFRWQLA